MAAHSSVLAWRIQGLGSLVGCRLWGRTESDMTEATQQQQQQQQGKMKLCLNDYVFQVISQKSKNNIQECQLVIMKETLT